MYIINFQLLRLSKASLGKTAAGQIINLMSNDVRRFDDTPIFLHYLWLMPIQAVVSTAIMYSSIGKAAIVGVLAIVAQAVILQGNFYFLALSLIKHAKVILLLKI